MEDQIVVEILKQHENSLKTLYLLFVLLSCSDAQSKTFDFKLALDEFRWPLPTAQPLGQNLQQKIATFNGRILKKLLNHIPASQRMNPVMISSSSIIFPVAPPVGQTSLDQLYSAVSLSVKKAPVFSIGRFQVTPSEDITAVHHQETRPLNQATPTAHSPPPFRLDQLESSVSNTEEHSESDSSISTVTVSPAEHPLGHHDILGRQGKENKEEEEEEEEKKRKGGQRLSVSLWEGSAGNPGISGSSFGQSWSRAASYMSSDESESENEELWVELEELRER